MRISKAAAIFATIVMSVGFNSSGRAATDVPGSFFQITPSMTEPGIPISLTSLGVKTWDFVGFRVTGEVSSRGGADNEPVHLDGVYTKSGTLLQPAQFSSDELEGDGPYFLVPWWWSVTFRVPKDATDVRLAVPNWYVPRETLTDPNSNFGVLITRPNNPFPIPIASMARAMSSKILDSTSGLEEPHEGIPEQLIENVLRQVRNDKSVPTLSLDGSRTTTAAILASATNPPMPKPQYRGWYRKCAQGQTLSCWRPDESRFCNLGAQSSLCPRGKSHKGADIFAPVMSLLRAPVDGTFGFVWGSPENGNNGGFGNIAWVAFKVEAQPYIIMYAHLRSGAGGATSGSIVRKGSPIARAGCSGNAETQWCPRESPEGGRSDHVHVELIKGNSLSTSFKRLDPNSSLDWNIECTGAPC